LNFFPISKPRSHIGCKILQHFEQSSAIHIFIQIVVVVIVVIVVVIVVIVVIVIVDILLYQHSAIQQQHQKAEKTKNGKCPFLSGQNFLVFLGGLGLGLLICWYHQLIKRVPTIIDIR
jgi:hypothetical protein